MNEGERDLGGVEGDGGGMDVLGNLGRGPAFISGFLGVGLRLNMGVNKGKLVVNYGKYV